MAEPKPSDAARPSYQRAVEQAAGFGLFSPGGSFERFPGAVLLVGADGAVLGANGAGEPIAALIGQGGSPELAQATRAALDGRAAQINPLLLGSGAGGQRDGLAFDLAILPWTDGTALLLGRDITLERSLRAALIESRQRYKDLVEAASDFAWETDAEGRFGFVSAQGALGYGAAEMVGMPARDLHLDRADGQESPFTARVPVQELEVWARQADGEPACLLATALPLYGPDGEWCGARGLCRNITARRSHEAALAGDRHRERLLAYILRMVRDEMDPAQMLNAAAGALVPALPVAGVCIYRRDRAGELVPAAQAGALPDAARLAFLARRIERGEDEAEAEAPGEGGMLLIKATRFQGAVNGALCCWRRGEAAPWSGEDRSLLAEIAGQVGVANQQLAREEELEERSSSDPLTGLLNRRGFMEALERRYARGAGRGTGAALFFIDLDNFKLVNDRHGHQEGDDALVALAEILRQGTRGRDLAGRLGGDEFAVFIEDIAPEAAEQKGRALHRAAAVLGARSGDPARPLGLSIGIAVCAPGRRETLERLIGRADRAMYEVKRRGKGGVQLAPGAGEAAER